MILQVIAMCSNCGSEAKHFVPACCNLGMFLQWPGGGGGGGSSTSEIRHNTQTLRGRARELSVWAGSFRLSTRNSALVVRRITRR